MGIEQPVHANESPPFHYPYKHLQDVDEGLGVRQGYVQLIEGTGNSGIELGDHGAEVGDRLLSLDAGKAGSDGPICDWNEDLAI